jgi:hypothetical protein
MTKQVLETGYLLHSGGRDSYGDWSLNENVDTRYPARAYTEQSSRPGNPGFVGGMEFIADVQNGTRMAPSGRKHTKRTEFNDYEYYRFKQPTMTYALQYNQTYPWLGSRRQGPDVEMTPDSAILEARRNNPFAVPLNPYEKNKELPA